MNSINKHAIEPDNALAIFLALQGTYKKAVPGATESPNLAGHH